MEGKNDIKKRILEELKQAKQIQRNLMEIQEMAEEIGYETQFAMEDKEESARSAYLAGYKLGVQDGYVECLQRMLVMYEEDKNGIY